MTDLLTLRLIVERAADRCGGSHAAVAERLGISRATISRYLSGRYRIPEERLHLLRELAGQGRAEMDGAFWLDLLVGNVGVGDAARHVGQPRAYVVAVLDGRVPATDDVAERAEKALRAVLGGERFVDVAAPVVYDGRIFYGGGTR